MTEDPGLHWALGATGKGEISVCRTRGGGLSLPCGCRVQLHPASCLCYVPSPQLYDFTAADEMPCAVAFHPTQRILACGFGNGMVRTFSLAASDLLVEHK